MHSASSRMNTIMMFTLTVMAIMCGINYLHGRVLYQPSTEVQFSITNIVNFMRNSKGWDQLSFRYNMEAGK
jgi:hypothetical protein